MSQIESMLTMTFRANAGQLIATMGGAASSLGRVGTAIGENTRMSERLNNQWRAMGTTIRYALAGGVIFGFTRLIGQVRDLNVQLGQMQALSDIGSGIRYSTSDINSLFQNLQTTAVNTITPLSQVNDAAINFLSTVQDVKPSDLPAMLQQIGQGAKLAQTPMDTLTQSATTMQIAFQRAVNPQTIGQFERMWVRLIGIAPGGVTAAPSIAGALPGLASMFQMAPGRGVAPRIAQAQMMALTQGVLQTGMPANTAMRGLTYLIQSVAQPTGKARSALAGIGITPQFVAQHGVTAAVLRLLSHVAPVSKKRAAQLGQIPDEQMDENMNLPGISGQQMTMLRAMVPRIHGIRAAIILASQLQAHGKVDSLLQDIQHMINVQNEQSKEAHQVAQAWTDLRNRSKLADVANAINVMQLQIAQAFAPVLGFAARPLAWGAGVARHHQTATRYAAYGAAGVGAFYGIMRATGLGTKLGLPRLLGGAGGAGGAAAQKFEQMQAAKAIATGATGLGASPLTPMYVTIVGPPLLGPATSGPTGGGGGNGGGGGGLFGWLKNKVPFVAGASRFLTPAAMVTAAYLTRNYMQHYVASPMERFLHLPGAFQGEWTKWSPSGRPYVENQFGKKYVMSRAAEHTAELHRAQKFFGKDVTGISGYHAGVDIKGQAEIYLNIDSRDANGRMVRQRVHVPVAMWQSGRAPSSKGKPITHRTR